MREDYHQRMEQLEQHWPELLQQDRWANGGGFPLEMISAWGYARRDGTTPERYIIEVLRAERLRRQQQDGIAESKVMLDAEIDAAQAEGTDVLTYVAVKYGDHDGDITKLARDFIIRIARRLEERRQEGT